MRPFVSNGRLWRVIRVPAGDPRLVDRTGRPRLGTTDPTTLTVAVDAAIVPPMLDRVVLHEVTHAVTMSWGLLPRLRSDALRGDLTAVEEWSAQLVENHAIEALTAARTALGRPVCVRGECSW